MKTTHQPALIHIMLELLRADAGSRRDYVARVFGLCLTRPGLTVLWTAHGTDDARNAFQMCDGITKDLRVSPEISRTWCARGEQRIEFVNGSRILFGARQSWFGRGFSVVDVVVFDQAEQLTDDMADAITPALFSAVDPMTYMIHTPQEDSGDGAAAQAS